MRLVARTSSACELEIRLVARLEPKKLEQSSSVSARAPRSRYRDRLGTRVTVTPLAKEPPSVTFRTRHKTTVWDTTGTLPSRKCSGCEAAPPGGFEPPTSWLTAMRSNQLSYEGKG